MQEEGETGGKVEIVLWEFDQSDTGIPGLQVYIIRWWCMDFGLEQSGTEGDGCVEDRELTIWGIPQEGECSEIVHCT